MKNITIVSQKNFDDVESANLFCRFLKENKTDYFRRLKTVFFLENKTEDEGGDNTEQ